MAPMKTTKLIALAAIVPLFLGVTQAQATTKKKPKPKPKKPTCHLIQDGSSDGTGTGTGQPGPNDPNLDIQWVDVVTNATQLSVIFHTASWEDNDTNSPAGRSFQFSFRVDGTAQPVSAVIYPGGQTISPTG